MRSYRATFSKAETVDRMATLKISLLKESRRSSSCQGFRAVVPSIVEKKKSADGNGLVLVAVCHRKENRGIILQAWP